MELLKLMNYSADMCPSCQGTIQCTIQQELRSENIPKALSEHEALQVMAIIPYSQMQQKHENQ
jgi:hypothetical protein